MFKMGKILPPLNFKSRIIKKTYYSHNSFYLFRNFGINIQFEIL